MSVDTRTGSSSNRSPSTGLEGDPSTRPGYGAFTGLGSDPSKGPSTGSGGGPATDTPRGGGMFTALANHNYRIYLTGSFVSNIGTWMQRVAQDWLVLELSGGSGVALGVTTGLQFLPMLLLSPYGGLIADRFDKRQVLKVTQLWLALCAASLGILAITGLAETWHVYLLALLFGVGTAFDNPARQAFVPEVVGAEHLPNAIGLNSAAFHAARIVGPAVAGLVIAAVGSGWAILGNGVTYAAFIAGLLLLDARRLKTSPRVERAKRQIRDSVSYVRRRSDLVLVLAIVFFVGTFGMNFQMTSALMAQQEFHRGAEQYGILGTFMAVGSLGGALLAARRRQTPSTAFLVTMAVVFGAVEVVAGLMPTYWTYAAVLPVLGLAALLTLTAANASVQLRVDSALRGRVMALYMMLLLGGTPVGAPLLGWIGEVFGARWTLIGGGALTIVGVILSVVLVRRRSRKA